MNRGFFHWVLACVCLGITSCPAAPARVLTAAAAPGGNASNTTLPWLSQQELSHLSLIMQATGAVHAAMPPPGDGHILISPKGDRFHGTMLSFDSERTGLLWRHSHTHFEAQIPMDDFGQVILPGRKPENRRQPSMRLTMYNHDTIAGDVVSADDSNIVMDTWYAGRLAVRRKGIRSMERTDAHRSIYEGPNDIAEWRITPSTGNLRPGSMCFVDNGSLVTIGNVGVLRDLGRIPDQCEFRFTVVSPPIRFFCFSFFADIDENGARSGYRLTLDGNAAYLETIPADTGRRSGNRFIAVVPAEKKEVHYAIRASRKTGTVFLSVDGKDLRSWKTEPQPGDKGHSIGFTSIGASGLEVRNIGVSEWNGVLLPQPDPSAPRTNTVVTFMNGDILTAEFRGVTNDKAIFETSYGQIPIPLTRICSIALAAGDTNVYRSTPGTVRIVLPENGRISASALKVDGGKAFCSSDSIGTVSFPLTSLRGIERLSTKAIETYTPKPLEDVQALPNPLDSIPRIPNPLNDVRLFGKGGGL